MSNSSENNRTYRIRTKVGNNENSDKVVSINLNQDIDIVELLSLKIDTTNFYKLHTSNYGCIAGRVLANGGVGVPNAKISVFVGISDNTKDDPVLSELYPFSTSFQKNSDGIRYNLLPDTEVTLCHTAIGTFPSKRLVLDDENMNKVFEKYYKYTTRTNDAGDYMIFGVPVGNQIVHTDIDLSDIGILSQKPRDMIYKGYNITQFENANKFKKDTNIDNLTQVISQNDTVYVFPFWGEESESEIKITRNDIDIQYKFEPTCVFIGSLVTDEKSNGVMKNCIATERMGKMDRITTGSGTIEMIRKKPNGDVEEIAIQGNQLIDGNGTWCYQIPMNLDYYMTDEYGNLVPSNDKDKGIPTRTSVRFRVSLNDFQSDYENNHLSKVLIPNNPKTYEELDYHFGSKTADSSFRDLFWNNVYTVKSYIPRIQKGNYNRNKKFTGFKQVNVNGSNNPIPYNNMRVNLTFMFVLQCAILKLMIRIIGFINTLKGKSSDRKCSVLGDGICPDLENWYFAPNCPDGSLGTTLDVIKQSGDEESTDSKNEIENASSNFCVTNKINYLMQCVEINLAMEYEVIQFDFYNDWINGMIYMPRWFVNIRKKRSYLFGLIRRSGRTEACMEDTYNSYRRFVQQCALTYTTESDSDYFTKVTTPKGCKNNSKQKCHRGYGRDNVKIFKGLGGGGLVHAEETVKAQKVYYFKPAEWLNINNNGYSTKCTMFATDIVLLGSLKDYNQYGIPKAFEELTSSTYLMPTNLAATNMDSEGYMYGVEGHGTRCTGANRITKGIKPYEQTFENYVQWSKNTDYFEKTPDDVIEYPITEASGIDWGYSGPKQGDSDLGSLYFPGGHFLGIACFSAEVNIKSCVNLSRMCEFGSMMSQRQLLLTKKEDSDDIHYNYLIPNGLISKYEVSDSNFRKMFATMNHNGLKTKLNTETSYPEYDFTPIIPTNFAGELSTFVNNDVYNQKITNEGYADTYRSVIESVSHDYYCFRMGIHEGDTRLKIRNKYLIQNGNNVSIPVYENSFYFYFGLKDGNTAIDRFFKDFYAKCETYDEDSSYITIDLHDQLFCTNVGSADIHIEGVDSPFAMALTKDDYYSTNNTTMYLKEQSNMADIGVGGVTIKASPNSWEGNEFLMHNYKDFTITNISKGTYFLELSSESHGNLSASFRIGETVEGSDLDSVVLDSYNFDEGYTNFDENSLSKRTGNDVTIHGGYITIDGVKGDQILGLLVFTDEKYILTTRKTIYDYAYSRNSIGCMVEAFYTSLGQSISFIDSWADTTGDITKYTIPVWRGNDSYNVAIITSCTKPQDERQASRKVTFEGQTMWVYDELKIYSLGNAFITMDTPLDVYVGDSDLTYRNTIININKDTWAWDIITSQSSTYSDKKKWNAKHALYYRYSMYDQIDHGNLNVYPANGTTPYVESFTGKTEMIVNGDDFITYDFSETAKGKGSVLLGDDQIHDIHDFYLPTHYINKDNNLVALNINAFKGFDVVDGDNNYIYGENSDFWNSLVTRIMANSFVYNGYKIPPKISQQYKSVPKYTYQVSDASARNNKTDIMTVPSIYRPFYFNALMIVRSNHVGNVTADALVTVTNPIPYAGKVVDVTVTGSIDKNEGKQIMRMNGESTGEFHYQGYMVCSERLSVTSVSNENSIRFSVEVNDIGPKDYNDNIPLMTLSESVGCVFPSKDMPYYSSGVRFYVLDNNPFTHFPACLAANILCGSGEYYNPKESDFEYYGEELSLLNDYSHSEDDKQSWNGIYGGKIPGTRNGQSTYFKVNLRDITDKIYDALYGEHDSNDGKELWDYFVETVARETGTQGDPAYRYLIAIYDNWTKEGSRTDEFMYKNVAPDTNIISIVRYYSDYELS